MTNTHSAQNAGLWWRRWYGAGPGHLLLTTASLVLVCYAGLRLLDADEWMTVVYWVVGAALVHDLVLVPLYAAIDRGLRALLAPHLVNYVRWPATASALLLLVWFPLISRAVDRYERATLLPADVFLVRWLLMTAALFALSLAVAALRAVRRRRAGPGGVNAGPTEPR
ncbi:MULTISPECIES: hypothetical protein [unclassified Streptomyces]|uniref:hypothetical protein n=1 Tax=unclassified Streptomyces TaxID=2593676 RepID=UPI000B1B44F5|nr:MULTISPECIES: hypothetical protein [unclassified Streptomyces]